MQREKYRENTLSSIHRRNEILMHDIIFANIIVFSDQKRCRGYLDLITKV